jgi:hypothetical protein
VADCLGRQRQPPGDLGVGQPLGQQAEYLDLPAGEAGRVGGRGPGRSPGDAQVAAAPELAAQPLGRLPGPQAVQQAQRLQQGVVLVAAGQRKCPLVRPAERPPGVGGPAPVAGQQQPVRLGHHRRRRHRFAGEPQPGGQLPGEPGVSVPHGQLEGAGDLLDHPAVVPGQPGVLGPGRGHRGDPLQLAGGIRAFGGLLEGGRGVGVAAAGLEQAQRHQGVHHPGAALHRLGQRRPRILLGAAPVAQVQAHAGPVAEHVLDVAGQLLGLDEGEGPVQVRAGVPVVPHLGGDGGQVAQGPGGVVFQAGGHRRLEPLLQLVPAALLAGQQPGRADVGQGVGQGLLVVQSPGQLDRPPGPAHRRLVAVGQHVELAWLL